MTTDKSTESLDEFYIWMRSRLFVDIVYFGI